MVGRIRVGSMFLVDLEFVLVLGCGDDMMCIRACTLCIFWGVGCQLFFSCCREDFVLVEGERVRHQWVVCGGVPVSDCFNWWV